MSKSAGLTYLANRLRIWIWLALALALVVSSAQALSWTCGELRTRDELFEDEREWYEGNCTGQDDDDDDGDDDDEDEDGGVGVGVGEGEMEQESNRPPAVTCPHLPPGVVVYGYVESTQCQRVGAAGVGNAELIAQGVVDAVDVWSNVNAEMQVCFRREGSLKFLDAATAPRAVSDLPTETFEGMTCGRIDRAGTVVLLQAQETAAVVSDSSSAPEATVPSRITGCQLETTGYLSLRGGPSISYARILFMPRGTRLVGRARISDWFMVDYEGQLGWASGTYLEASPDCADLGDEGAIILPPTAEQPASEAGAPEAAGESAQPQTTEQGEQSLVDCQLRTGDILNLREGPGLAHPVLAEIPNQTVLAALARAGDWFKVEYLEQTGWVNIDYVFRSGACG